MVMLFAILIILFESIGEGLLKRFSLAEWIFELWLQWVIAFVLFGLWFLIAYNFNPNFIPIWKLITGFIFVRFLIFDVAWNLSRGVKWNYYGDTKLYDRIMTKLASWGWFLKLVLGVIGIVFLIR